MNVSNNNQAKDNTYHLLPLIKIGLSIENSFFRHDSLMYFFQTNKFWNAFIHTNESTRACTRFCIERMKSQIPSERPHIEKQLKENIPPIIIASATGSVYVVKLLMLAKASHLARSPELGFTPLMTAILHGHEKVVEMLLSDEQNRESSLQAHSTGKYIKWTAVRTAANEGQVNILKILARSITSESLRKDKYGWSETLLETAQFQKPTNVEVMNILLQAYYDHQMTPEDDLLATALKAAKQSEQQRLIPLLEGAQARNKSIKDAQGRCVVS